MMVCHVTCWVWTDKSVVATTTASCKTICVAGLAPPVVVDHVFNNPMTDVKTLTSRLSSTQVVLTCLLELAQSIVRWQSRMMSSSLRGRKPKQRNGCADISRVRCDSFSDRRPDEHSGEPIRRILQETTRRTSMSMFNQSMLP